MNLFYLNELPSQINLGNFCRMPYHHVKSQPNLCNTQYRQPSTTFLAHSCDSFALNQVKEEHLCNKFNRGSGGIVNKLIFLVKICHFTISGGPLGALANEMLNLFSNTEILAWYRDKPPDWSPVLLDFMHLQTVRDLDTQPTELT